VAHPSGSHSGCPGAAVPFGALSRGAPALTVMGRAVRRRLTPLPEGAHRARRQHPMPPDCSARGRSTQPTPEPAQRGPQQVESAVRSATGGERRQRLGFWQRRRPLECSGSMRSPSAQSSFFVLNACLGYNAGHE
jgi:hypothetical protein